MLKIIFFLSLAFLVSGENGGILQIHYPNISLEADKNGSVYMKSGSDASVYVLPGPGGTVYYEGEDLIQLIKLINGLPPVWKPHSSTGFFTTSYGGMIVDVKLEALDPQNGKLNYKVVAGTMPPGLTLESNNSRIYGRVPDVDGLYSFTVRATNTDDKYADAIFRMEIIETNQCITQRPCQHGGQCVDILGEIGYQCYCSDAYSGQDCEISCSSNRLGVSNSSIIPDAQMSGYLSHGTYLASAGRLGGSGQGWCGENKNSWLQVDLGSRARIFSTIEQSYTSSYYTGSYYLSHSTDGVHFDYVYQTNSTTTKEVLSGSSSSSLATATLPDPIIARFVRFHPVSYSSSYYPCMRVELNGCYI